MLEPMCVSATAANVSDERRGRRQDAQGQRSCHPLVKSVVYFAGSREAVNATWLQAPRLQIREQLRLQAVAVLLEHA
jgi:hypothetical protein